MAYSAHIRNERTLTVLHLIDAGATTIPAIVAAAAADGRLDDRAVRWTQWSTAVCGGSDPTATLGCQKKGGLRYERLIAVAAC